MSFDNVRFTSEHEWVRFQEDDDEVEIGITDFAAGELGDIVYVELPEAGSEVQAMESMGTIEAVKTVADLYAPISGTITEVNPALEDNPEIINSNPYEDGWLCKIQMANSSDLEDLRTYDAYQEMIGKG